MPILLLDRDGVLVPRRTYDYLPAHMTPLPGAVEGLRRFRDAGYRFFVVSNQSGVSRGLQTLESVIACNERLTEAFAREGVVLEDCVFCPHQDKDGCACRKPKTGMWEELVRRHGLRADETLMVGDRAADIQLAQNIGCPAALIGDPQEPFPEPEYRVKDLAELAGKRLGKMEH